ncbi:uncharacterized protein LOC106064881 isoform X2 [Biomphalaria glabrata]|uniref:Uncharacterized protein LOC106064881 isoform X2 n=1 Tax=Biomphalaria glabrata TaxID=6526 RepID=A0A9W3BMD8_BIOGL|nr:uncharacterized protein LOC106064881 isoform X2 [Biomphalaria glabrata]
MWFCFSVTSINLTLFSVAIVTRLYRMVSSDCSNEKRGRLDRTKRDRSELLRTLPPCRVCLEAASGFHYGVNTCEACKGFFRRALKHGTTFTCKQQKECDVTGTARTLCSYCRFQKCICVGMSTSAIKVGRYTHEARTRNIIEVKILAKQKKELKKSVGSSTHARQKEEYETQLEVRKQHLLLRQEHRLAEEALRMPLPNECPQSLVDSNVESQYNLTNEINDYTDYSGTYCSYQESIPQNFPPPDFKFDSHNDISLGYETSFKCEHYQDTDYVSDTTHEHLEQSSSHSPQETILALPTINQENYELPFCFDSYNFNNDIDSSQGQSHHPAADVSLVQTEHYSSLEEEEFTDSKQPSSWDIRALLPVTFEARLESITKETSIYNGNIHLKEHLSLLMQFQHQNIQKQFPWISSDVIGDELDSVITKLIDTHNRLILVSDYFPDSYIEEKLKAHIKVYVMKQQVMGQLPDLTDQQYVDMFRNTGIDLDGRVNNIKVLMNYLEVFLRAFVRFAKCLPGFKELPLDDQTQLLKGVYKGYNSQLNTVIMPQSHCFHRDDLYKMFDPSWVDHSFELAVVLQKKSISPRQLILLKSLLLTVPYGCTILNPQAVDKIQDRLLECLQRQLSIDHPDQNIAQLLGKTINILTLLRPLSQLEKRNWQKRIVLENAACWPLVSEMFCS